MDGNKADFGEWLLQQIERHEWTQADFARESKLNPQNISRWINGERVPSPKSCLQIAKVFRVNEDIVLRLAGHKAATNYAPPPRSPVDDIRALAQRLPRAIPHHSQLVSAGKGEPMIDGYVYLDEDDRVGPNDFALTVTGTCMEPEISPGDRVVVDPDRIPETGNLIVFTLDDEQIMVKRLVWKEGKRWLEPRNGLPILYDERVVRTGVVRRVIKRY